MNLNRVLLMGRLTRDPELRHTKDNTPVAEISLALNRKFTTAAGEARTETTFVDVVFWMKMAEQVAAHFKKSSPIFVEGRLELDTWERDGQKRSRLRVVAERYLFLEKLPIDEHKTPEELGIEAPEA
jgi:single-strand DNA-binding protein